MASRYWNLLAIPGFARFEARDPFGNRFECIQPLE